VRSAPIWFAWASACRGDDRTGDRRAHLGSVHDSHRLRLGICR
jgi:hypothetical protein